MKLTPAAQFQRLRPPAPPACKTPGNDLDDATVTLFANAYTPKPVTSAALDRALEQAQAHVPGGAWPNQELFQFLHSVLPATITPGTEVMLVVGRAFDHHAVMRPCVRFIRGPHLPWSGFLQHVEQLVFCMVFA